MAQVREIASAAAEVLLEPRASGTCAVYIVEVRNRQEIREVKELFGSLDAELEIRQLAEGTVTAYAVRVTGRDLRVLDEVELALKENYRFSISERSFQPSLYTVLGELCDSSGSILRPVPTCGICQAPDPFPTTVEFVDATNHRLAEGCYCARCVNAMEVADDRDLTVRLLAADRTGLAPLGRLRLTDRPRQYYNAAQFEVEEEPLLRLAVNQ